MLTHRWSVLVFGVLHLSYAGLAGVLFIPTRRCFA